VTTASTDLARLTAVIGRQRQELDRMRAEAAARSVTDIAQGVLMERLGCPAAEAASQLTRLAAEAGIGVAELAAEITGQRLAAEFATGALAGDQAAGDEPLAASPDGASDPVPGWDRLSQAGAAAALAADGDAIAQAALAEALAPAGASALLLWLIAADGSLELAGQAGLGLHEAGRWQHVPPVMDCPAQQVARGGAALFWPAGPPAQGLVPAPGGWPGGARAVLPMAGPGTAAGVLEVCWPAAIGRFGRPLRQQLLALADLCGRALVAGAGPARWLSGLLDGLLESAVFARPLRDRTGAVTDFEIGHVSSGLDDPAGRDPADLRGRPLLETFPRAAVAGGLFDHAVQVLATGEPQQLAGVVLTGPPAGGGAAPVLDIRVSRVYDGVVITWRRAGEAGRLASLLEHAERLGRIGGWEENLLTGEIQWTDSAYALFGLPPGAAVPLADLHDRVLPDDAFDVAQFRAALLTDRRAAAAAFRIIRADDESVRYLRVFAEPVTGAAGDLAAVRGAFQDVSAYYHTQVALSATRDRLADTEERAEEEHRLALRLQQAITPRSAEPVAAAGLDIAARYRPAGPGSLVSGDWYDTVPLPSGLVLLVVGDIAGHGIDAVTGMVALRNCLRGLAITGAGPGVLLGWLNQVACHLTDGIIGTAICGLYDPAARSLRWARAGHLPPVLVRDAVAAELRSDQALLLGADPDATYPEETALLRPGDGLLLFTDGLVEQRGEPIDATLAALLRAASRPIDGIAGYADHLLRNSASDTGDDACLVAVQIR
jgi:PAS domain-containing protein